VHVVTASFIMPSMMTFILFASLSVASGDSGPPADIAAIRQQTQEFVAGFNTGDLDRVMRFYADEYVDVNQPRPVQTKAERRDYYRQILEKRNTTVQVTPDEVVIHGDYGFVRGTILLTKVIPGQAPKRTELRYVEVWRRFPNGWKSIWGIDAEIYAETR
jgi:ketosteroid isomerase-like protein